MFFRLRTGLAAALALFAFAAPSSAQCLDFEPGFGIPGQGVAGNIFDFVTHDFGGGAKLYTGGQFTSAGGVTAANVAVWNATSWSALGAGLGSVVRALTVFDDGSGAALYAAGNFTSSGAQPLHYVAKWDGSAWVDVGGGANHFVFDLAVFDDGTGPALYACGLFTQIGGGAANRFAKWDGTSWSAIGSGLTGTMTDVYGDFLAVGDDGVAPFLGIHGRFNSAGGVACDDFIRWRAAGFSNFSVPPPGGVIFNLAQYDDGAGARLVVGTNYQNHTTISRWTGSAWSVLGFAGGYVARLWSGDDGLGPALFAGGTITDVNSMAVGRVAKFQGGAWSPLGSGMLPGDSVSAFASYDAGQGPQTYLGGLFTSAGGYPARSFTRWGDQCVAPTITQEPVDVTAAFPAYLTLDVRASGTAPLTYQWRKDGVDLADILNHAAGTQTNHLIISSWAFADAGSYDCVVTNAHGTAVSQPAVFTVPAGGYSNTPVQLTRIVRKGDLVPGASGAHYDNPLAGLMLASGEVLFPSVLDTTVSAYSHWAPSGATLLTTVGDLAPGTPAGVRFSQLNAIAGRGLSNHAFLAGLTGPGVTAATNSGLWLSSSSGVQLVVRKGDAVAGAAPGSTVNAILASTRMPATSASGAVLYEDVTWNGSVGFRSLRVFDPVSGALEICRTGTVLPGTSSPLTVLDELPAFLGDTDTVAFGGALASGDRAIWISTSGTTTLIALSTDPAPGFVTGTVLGDLFVGGSAADDRLCFTAAPREPGGTQRRALYEWTASAGLAPIVRSDEIGPGVTQPFAWLTYCDATSDGRVVFIGSHYGGCTGCPSKTLWLKDASGLHLIASELAGSLPEIPASWNLAAFKSAAINDHGEVVFASQYFQGSDYRAVFGWTADGGVFPIAIPGTQIELAPGESKTVLVPRLSTPAGGLDTDSEFGHASLNEAGEIALSIRFSDQDVALFVGQFERIGSLYVLAPVVISDPSGARVQPGEAVTLPAIALGQEPLAYQWRQNGVDVFDDVTHSGAQTATLSISSAAEFDAGAYTLLVANAYGTDESAPGVLRVEPGDAFCSGDGSLTDHTTDCPCGNHGDPGHGCAHSFDVRGAELTATGTTWLDDLVLRSQFEPVSSFTLFMQHDAADDRVFHDGVLCANGNLVRLRGRAAVGGEASYPNSAFANDSLTLSQRGGVFPGQGVRRYYGAWFRNASTTFCPPATANVTNGYRVDW